MRAPAVLPSAAIVAGVSAACLVDVAPAWTAAASAAGWIGALAAWQRSRAAAFTAAVTVAFGAAAWGISSDAFRRAEAPLERAPLDRLLSEQAPTVVQGRLRRDAAAAPGGVQLDLEMTAGAGVRLTVGGSLAPGLADRWTAGRLVRAVTSLRLPARSLDPGVPDARLNLARRGTALVGSVKSGALVEVLRPGTWPHERAAALRRFARRAIGRHVGRFSPRSAGIVVAILIGDRAGLDDETQRRLQEAGTYHVIAISGGNIAILAGLLFGLLRLARVPARGACWLTMAGLAGYAFLAGGGASVSRATLMGCTYLAARQADHRSPPLNALAVACGVVLLATPLAICDVGFALTFGASLGILAGASAAGGPVVRMRWLRGPAALLLASACAELSLFPVSALAFSRVTFAGLALNFLAIPAMTVVQVTGMAVLALEAIGLGGAVAAGRVAHIGAEVLVRSAGLVDLAPWLSRRLPPPSPLVLALYYGSWCALLWLRTPRASFRLGASTRALRRSSAVVIAASGAWILVEPISLLAPGVSGRLRVTVLDVAQADAVLVQLPDRRSLLVDAGGSAFGGSFDVGGRVVAPALWALGTRRLDALIVSHGDPDHVGGAASIVRDFRPREIWEGVPVPQSAPMARLKAQAARAGIRWRERRAGESVVMGGVTIRIWHPPDPDWERQKVRNDDSMVVELRFGGVSIVLPGDIGRDVERELAARIPPARLRVLKVPHHGSLSSSSVPYLEALRPDVAVISAGAATKVSDEVLARYRAVGATVFRTSQDGAVTITTDGRTVRVDTFQGRTRAIR